MIKVLELFAGSRSIGKVAEKLGYKVFSSDNVAFDGVDYVVDILQFDETLVPFVPDIIHASPPCQGFSVAAIGKNWVSGFDFKPKSDSALLSIALTKKNNSDNRVLPKTKPKFDIYYRKPPR